MVPFPLRAASLNSDPSRGHRTKSKRGALGVPGSILRGSLNGMTARLPPYRILDKTQWVRGTGDILMSMNSSNPPALKSLGDRRAEACLKACDGIPLEALENNVIVRLVAACVHLKDPEVSAILEEMSPTRPKLVRR